MRLTTTKEEHTVNILIMETVMGRRTADDIEDEAKKPSPPGPPAPAGSKRGASRANFLHSTCIGTQSVVLDWSGRADGARWNSARLVPRNDAMLAACRT